MNIKLPTNKSDIERYLGKAKDIIQNHSIWIIFGIFSFSLFILISSIQKFSSVEANSDHYSKKVQESQLPNIDPHSVEKLQNPGRDIDNGVDTSKRQNPFYE